MSCSDVRDLLHPYLDGELDLVRTLDVERHLGGVLVHGEDFLTGG